MRTTDPSSGPALGPWESAVAHMARSATLTGSSLWELAAQIPLNGGVEKYLEFGVRAERARYAEYPQEIRAAISDEALKPRRLVCTGCIRERLADSLYERHPYNSYCFKHGVPAVARCPQCKRLLRYGASDYDNCACGLRLDEPNTPGTSSSAPTLYMAAAANVPIAQAPASLDPGSECLDAIHERLSSTWRFICADTPEQADHDPAELLSNPAMLWPLALDIVSADGLSFEQWVVKKIQRWREYTQPSLYLDYCVGDDFVRTNHFAWSYLQRLVDRELKTCFRARRQPGLFDAEGEGAFQ